MVHETKTGDPWFLFKIMLRVTTHHSSYIYWVFRVISIYKQALDLNGFNRKPNSNKFVQSSAKIGNFFFWGGGPDTAQIQKITVHISITKMWKARCVIKYIGSEGICGIQFTDKNDPGCKKFANLWSKERIERPSSCDMNRNKSNGSLAPFQLNLLMSIQLNIRVILRVQM